MRLAAAGGLAALTLAGCATPSAVPPPSPTASRPPPIAPPPAPEPAARRLELSALPGWERENHLAAFEAYRLGCNVAKDPALRLPCGRARTFAPSNGAQARQFFEEHFQAESAGAPGVLTAYFAPVYPARSRPEGEFTAPVRPKPDDLVPGQPYRDRTAIENQPAAGALAWMRPEELFFLQVQGSGVLVFEDGRRLKALFAAHNGIPFQGIANPMRDRGLLARDDTSGDSIRAWLAAHRGPEADRVMRMNPRYVFFRLAPDDGKPPVGAANVPLPAGRAVAVDPAFHAMGQPLWIDADAPILRGAFPSYQGLVTALDTGGAIKGQVRADLYLGEGERAGAAAGRVRHTLRMWRLVPR